MHSPLRSRAIDLAVFVALLVLVWGLDPLARGMRFAGDDLNFIFAAWLGRADPWSHQIVSKYGLDGWTRLFAFTPFVVAEHLPWPVTFLQLFYGAAWLANGLAIAYLASVLRRGSRLAPFVAGCLMLTATSDYQTNILVYGPHLLGVALFFLGTAVLARSVESGAGAGRALTATVLLAVSFFTVEYAYPSAPLVLLLVWLHARSLGRSRIWPAVVALGVAFVPAALVLIRALQVPSHATEVLAPAGSPVAFGQFVLIHIAHNFWPVSWAFRAIPPWYDNYAPALSRGVFVAASALAALLALWRFRLHARDDARSDATSRLPIAFVATALLAIAAVNTVSATPGGEYFVRSHFVSRGWTSLALALIASGMIRWPPGRLAVGLAFGVFVFLGTWGGVERQSYLLAYAENERRELWSLRDQLPGFDPSAYLVVIQPPGSPTHLASTNPNSIPFMYGDVGIWNHVVPAANSAYEYSRVDGDDAGRFRILTNSTRETFVDLSTCIMVFYSISQGRFVRLDEIPAGLLRVPEEALARYQPDKWRRPSSTEPTAISEFLARGEIAAGRRPDRKIPHAPGLLSVPASLADLVQVDSLAPYGLEPKKVEGSLTWLGLGRPYGYSSIVWSRGTLDSSLALHIMPGPSRSPASELVVRVTRADRTRSVVRQPFSSPTGDYVAALPLANGSNIVEVWLEGAPALPTPPGGDQRPLFGLLDDMRLQPLSRRE